MLRRPLTVLQLTPADIQSYESSRAARLRQQAAEQKKAQRHARGQSHDHAYPRAQLFNGDEGMLGIQDNMTWEDDLDDTFQEMRREAVVRGQGGMIQGEVEEEEDGRGDTEPDTDPDEREREREREMVARRKGRANVTERRGKQAASNPRPAQEQHQQHITQAQPQPSSTAASTARLRSRNSPSIEDDSAPSHRTAQTTITHSNSHSYSHSRTPSYAHTRAASDSHAHAHAYTTDDPYDTADLEEMPVPESPTQQWQRRGYARREAQPGRQRQQHQQQQRYETDSDLHNGMLVDEEEHETQPSAFSRITGGDAPPPGMQRTRTGVRNDTGLGRVGRRGGVR